MNKFIEKIIDFSLWLQKPWIKRAAQRNSDVLQAIWDVRWDYYGKQYWEISTFQLCHKLNRYNLGVLHNTINSLTVLGLVGSIIKDPIEQRRGRPQRMVFMLPKGIELMLEHLEKSK